MFGLSLLYKPILAFCNLEIIYLGLLCKIVLHQQGVVALPLIKTTRHQWLYIEEEMK